jgi:hypothetical protein
MVSFSPYKFPINDFIFLITNKSVERLGDRSQIQALGNRLDTILAFRGSIVAVRALEDEAEAPGGESDLGGFTQEEAICRSRSYWRLGIEQMSWGGGQGTVK